MAQSKREEFLDKIIAARFKASGLNNQKWVRLLGVLVKNANLIQQCQVKLIWEETGLRELLFDEHTQYRYDYYDQGMEAMLTGSPAGWYSYKEIEWIIFLAKTPPDLDLLRESFQQVGDLWLETEEGKIKLYGYR